MRHRNRGNLCPKKKKSHYVSKNVQILSHFDSCLSACVGYRGPILVRNSRRASEREVQDGWNQPGQPKPTAKGRRDCRPVSKYNSQ